MVKAAAWETSAERFSTKDSDSGGDSLVTSAEHLSTTGSDGGGYSIEKPVLGVQGPQTETLSPLCGFVQFLYSFGS